MSMGLNKSSLAGSRDSKFYIASAATVPNAFLTRYINGGKTSCLAFEQSSLQGIFIPFSQDRNKQESEAMKITTRMTLMVSSVALVFLVALIACVYGLRDLKTTSQQILSIEVETLVSLKEMHSHALQSGHVTRNVLLNPSDKSAVENYRQSSSDFTTLAFKLQKHFSPFPAEKGQIDTIIKSWEEKNKLAEQIQQLAVSGKADEAKRLLTEKETPAWKGIQELLQKLVKRQEERLTSTRNSMVERSELLSQVAITAALIAIIGGALSLFFLVRIIAGSVKKIMTGLQALTDGGGDLTREIEVSGKDELGDVAAGINTLIRWLRDMITTLYQEGGHVAVKVCEMTRTSRATVSTAMTQKEEAVAVAVAAEEMASTLNGVADNTHNAARVASTVHQAANTGMTAVEKACECMEGIKESVEVTRGTVERLSDSSVKIGEIAGMIEDIADQTNLLALNAAIEAARAGEHGRGFAVVADEVKNLSAKTAISTREITSIINAIRRESGLALNAMHEEYARVVDGVETAQAARAGLSHILSLAGESTDMINQIATATEEQSVVTSEITEKIQNISNMTQDVNTQMKATDDTLLHLSEVAEKIFSTVGCFSVGTYHDAKRGVAMNCRDRVSEALEQAVERGAISMDQLFSRNYTPIPNTNPQKYTTAFDSFFDQTITPIMEEVSAANPDLISVVCFDDKGYSPSQLMKNKARAKLVYNDRTSQRACKNTAPFLLQTFERPSTGEIMIDLACPIFVRGKHWGAVRTGYKPQV